MAEREGYRQEEEPFERKPDLCFYCELPAPAHDEGCYALRIAETSKRPPSWTDVTGQGLGVMLRAHPSPEAHRSIASLFVGHTDRYYVKVLADSLVAFRSLGRDAALYLIGHEESKSVARNLEKFDGLDRDAAIRLIDEGYSVDVLYQADRFAGLSQKEVADRLIKSGDASSVARYLFGKPVPDWVDDGMALQLLKAGEHNWFFANIGHFGDISHKTIALTATHGKGALLSEHVSKLRGLDLEVAIAFLEKRWVNLLLANLPSFPVEVQKQIALELIQRNFSFELARSISSFQGIDGEIALRMIKAGQGETVVVGLDLFSDIDDEKIAQALLDARPRALAGNLHKFHDLSCDVARRLVDRKEFSRDVAVHLRSFQGLDGYVADKLVSEGCVTSVVRNIERFSGVDYAGIAMRAVDKNAGSEVDERLDQFPGLDRTFLLAGLLNHGPDLYPNARRELADKPGTPWAESVLVQMNTLPKRVVDSNEFRSAMLDLRYLVDESAEDKADRIGWIPIVANARATRGLSPNECVSVLLDSPAFARVPPSFESAGRALEHASSDRMVEEEMGRMADLVGWDATMRFANRIDLSRHDAYLAFDPLMGMLLNNHVRVAAPADRPYPVHPGAAPWREVSSARLAELLEQVARDDSLYDEGRCSQREFEQALKRVEGRRVEDVLLEAESFEPLRERVRSLRENPRFDPLLTWKGLREYASICDMLSRREVLDALRGEGVNEAVRQFAYRLLEHPNVPATKVAEFLRDPGRFLSSEAQYVDRNIQARMAPSNMARIDRLGLHVEEIRDALADGTLDRLQVLPPAELELTLDAHGADTLGQDWLVAYASRMMGRRADKAQGIDAVLPEAASSRALFNAVRDLFNEEKIPLENLAPWLRGDSRFPPATWTPRFAGRLRALLLDPELGRAAAVERVRVRLGKKSDPSLIVAGNDTSSCMPFGDGKTNVYAWSPNCAQLVVERRLKDGTWRTMAQSVVMPTIPGDKPTPDRVKAFASGTHPHEVLDAQEFARPSVLLCDNAEPTPNDLAEGRRPLIESAYEKFFKGYLREHAAKLGVDSTRVALGKEIYIADRWTFSTAPNVFMFRAPLTYTDNMGTESYLIETGLPPVETNARAGVRDVTGADIMEMSYLEGKSFSDNAGMMSGLFHRQQLIVGTMISRERHGDPNLVFAARDDKGEPVGYMLAYVGHTHDVPEIFIGDFAVDRSKNLVASRYAIRLLETFVDRMISHYGGSNEPFPSVFAEMREATSYLLVTRQLKKIAEARGLVAEMEEEGVGELGGEAMHHVRIYFGRTQTQVNEARGRWNDRVARVVPVEPGAGGYGRNEDGDWALNW